MKFDQYLNGMVELRLAASVQWGTIAAVFRGRGGVVWCAAAERRLISVDYAG